MNPNSVMLNKAGNDWKSYSCNYCTKNASLKYRNVYLVVRIVLIDAIHSICNHYHNLYKYISDISESRIEWSHYSQKQ
jgi:hypothetical protein